MFLLSFVIVAFVATSVSLGADKPSKPLKDRASVPARFAPVYSFPGLTGSEYTAPPAPPEKVSLRGAKAGEGIVETIGSTTYDYQHNCSLGRQVEHRRDYSNPYNQYGFYVHFDWMAQTGDTLGSGRGIGYQAYEVGVCDHVFAPGGVRIESAYSGYVTLDANNIDALNSWGLPSAHQNEDAYHAKAYFDFTVGGPVFGVFTSDANLTDFYGYWQNDGTGTGNENIWPKIDWDINGDEDVLHMVTTESGGAAGDPQTFSYYRRVGPYGTGLGTWSDQRLIDTAMNINVTVASSPVSDKVAIVWNAPVDYLRDTPNEFGSQYENDIWFAIATDNGAAWENPAGGGTPGPSIGHEVDLGNGAGYNANGGNLTLYNPVDDYKAYCDISALWYIDELQEDYLQIVWGCRRWTDTTSLFRRQGAVYHWNQKTGSIRTVVKADWDSGGACYGHAWGTDVAKVTISQCDGKLYTSFTQFGDKDHPCDWYDAENNVVSGYLYMSVFDPGYDAWDRAQRITAISENATGCTPGTMAGAGDCNSEYWASMARYGRTDTCKVGTPGEVLDLLYINDYAPGGCVQTESGVWTVNPVNWVVYPCREAIPEADYSDDAGVGYGLCVNQPILVIGTTDDTTFTLTLENFGILDNTVNSIVGAVTGSNGPSNGANTTIGVSPSSGVIPGKGGNLPVTITITTTGEDNFSTVEGTITIEHTAWGTVNTRIIPVCITVIDDWWPAASVTLATTCKQLRVYNTGEISNNAANASLDFTDDPDDCANVYLYDASPIVCRDDGGTKRCYFVAYDNSYASDHALRQLTDITVNTDSADYTKASAEFLTGDSTIQMLVEYYAPTGAADCGYIIQKLQFWNISGGTLSNVAVGEVLDWDVPSFENGSNNESDYDATRGLIYQYCGCPAQRDQCDTLNTCDRFAGIASYGSGFKNYMTLQNSTYIYTSGPFGNDAPLPDDTTYGLMTGVDGFSTAQLDSCEDLFTLVTFDVYNLEPSDVKCVVKILTTSKEDNGAAASLKANVDAAQAFIDAHEEIQCPITDPCLDPGTACRPGDANGDGQVNVGDAVYIISYVFKGGPAPTPYAKCSGDANGDCQCNVGDAVYTISYVFKGGPPPVTCSAWSVSCGLPFQK